MFSLNLPSFVPKISEKNGKHLILDPIRKKYVTLTPEEWVRQHFVNYLITEKGYPKELTKEVRKGTKYGYLSLLAHDLKEYRLTGYSTRVVSRKELNA